MGFWVFYGMESGEGLGVFCIDGWGRGMGWNEGLRGLVDFV